jgi:predicted HD phosphohydrolase
VLLHYRVRCNETDQTDVRLLTADENVTQREHALQTALLAEQEAGTESHEIVTSSLLHDIGHLLFKHGWSGTSRPP